MSAVPAINTTLRREIMRILQRDITWQVQAGDTGDTIAASSVIYQKTRAQANRQFIKSNQLTDLPGIIVCEPFHIPLVPSEGTNELDLWHYMWLLQLIDKDLWDNDERIATWDKWVEQMISAFNFNSMGGVITLPTGQVQTATSTGLSDIDERMWIKSSSFVSGVQVTISVLQPRGIIA